MLARSITAIVALVTASAASAQWVPGMEITGQQVQVQTNGTMNTITFEPNGVARIARPALAPATRPRVTHARPESRVSIW